MFCRSLFVLFLLAFVLSVLLRFTGSDYSIGIFKLFLFQRLVLYVHDIIRLRFNGYCGIIISASDYKGLIFLLR